MKSSCPKCQKKCQSKCQNEAQSESLMRPLITDEKQAPMWIHGSLGLTSDNIWLHA